MKRTFIIITAFIIVLSSITSCANSGENIQPKDELDLSQVSFKLEIQNSRMTKDFGLYGEIENEVGIVLYGKVESGKISENSNVFFVDENGKILHQDTVFKIEIITSANSNSTSKKRQTFAENGDDAALYLKAGRGDDLDLYSEYSRILDSIRNSQFVVTE